jgi:hypothetical protein
MGHKGRENINTLEFDVNNRFFTILGIFLTQFAQKEHKGWFLRKCLK